MDIRFLAIEGNIGAGKTSLAKMISEEFEARLVLEQFADNPFLPKFYNDPEKYSFPLEMSFLAERYNQLKKGISDLELFSQFTVADYYFIKSLIFAKSTLSDDEYNLYRQFFEIIYGKLPRPDLYVYLHVRPERLLKNIEMRGRDYEKTITKEYLDKIHQGYLNFIKQQADFPILVLDTNDLDFVHNQSDYERIKEVIFQNDYKKGVNTVRL
ncbi:deoxynucleoside kinase [Prolixibacteraceae bacterium JC049]|nr:deoxynucleoside kinase [Prolixibacteraceae bacterium JC049]